MNLIAGDRRETALARPVLTLRVGYAATPNAQDEDAEHGRRHPDEITALVSLDHSVVIPADRLSVVSLSYQRSMPLRGPKKAGRAWDVAADVHEAFAELERGRARGKIVVILGA